MIYPRYKTLGDIKRKHTLPRPETQERVSVRKRRIASAIALAVWHETQREECEKFIAEEQRKLNENE